MGSLRDLNQQSGDSRTLGTHRVGYLPAELPASGTHGANPLLNDSLDPAKEYTWRIASWPAAGDLFAYEDGSFTFAPAADGEQTFAYTLIEDGIALVGTATVTLTSGAVVPAYAFTPAGLSLPLQLASIAWAYTPPAGGAYVLAPDTPSLPLQLGSIAWAYTPPVGGAYTLAPAGLSLPLQLGSIAWSYTPPPSGDRIYVRLPAGRRPDCSVHYTVVSQPAAPVLPLDLLHTHLRLGLQPGDTHPEDALYLGALASARSLAQHHTGRAIGQQAIEARIDAFPAGPIELPIGPAVAVLSVTYAAEVDGAFVETTMPPGDYVLHTHDAQAHLYAVDGWPAAARVVGAVTVRYLAGDMPDAVRQALLLVVGHYARHRQAVTDRQTSLLLLGVEALFDVDKVWGF